jgi:hypothetical protein
LKALIVVSRHVNARRVMIPWVQNQDRLACLAVFQEPLAGAPLLALAAVASTGEERNAVFVAGRLDHANKCVFLDRNRKSPFIVTPMAAA